MSVLTFVEFSSIHEKVSRQELHSFFTCIYIYYSLILVKYYGYFVTFNFRPFILVFVTAINELLIQILLPLQLMQRETLEFLTFIKRGSILFLNRHICFENAFHIFWREKKYSKKINK